MPKGAATVRFPEDLRWQLKQVASDRRMSMESALRDAFKMWIGEVKAGSVPTPESKLTSDEQSIADAAVQLIREGDPERTALLRMILARYMKPKSRSGKATYRSPDTHKIR